MVNVFSLVLAGILLVVGIIYVLFRKKISSGAMRVWPFNKFRTKEGLPVEILVSGIACIIAGLGFLYLAFFGGGLYDSECNSYDFYIYGSNSKSNSFEMSVAEYSSLFPSRIKFFLNEVEQFEHEITEFSPGDDITINLDSFEIQLKPYDNITVSAITSKGKVCKERFFGSDDDGVDYSLRTGLPYDR